MLFLETMSNIFLAKKLIALRGSDNHSEGHLQEYVAGVQGSGGRLALGVPPVWHGGRPASQEACPGWLHR